MNKMPNITIFQAPHVSLVDSGAWMKAYSNEKETIPAEYYMPVFRGEIEVPDMIPKTGDARVFTILEYVFKKFNLDHPQGYCGRSLSVGDVVALEGKHYLCRSIGFQECNFVTSTDSSLRNRRISPESIKRAEQVLIDSGIEKDEAYIVLQAIGYALLDRELYPEDDSGKNS